MTAQEYFLSIKDDRDAWANSQVQACMWCGRGKTNLEIHEIRRRSQAPRTFGQKTNYLLLCQKCHSGPFASMRIVKQLAVKMLRDEDNLRLDSELFKHLTLSDVVLASIEINPLPPLRPRRMPAF